MSTTKKETKPAKGVQKQTKTSKLQKFKNLLGPKPKNFAVGADPLPKRYLDLTRFVKWPKYIRVQRQKRVLMKRLRIPPAVNMFNRAANKPLAAKILTLLDKYRPEDRKEKQTRLREAAKKQAEGAASTPEKKAKNLVSGLNAVTRLVEKKKAQLVVIAHDVDPVELVVFLPSLCKKLDVPYVVVKSKARLGTLVHAKTAAVVALTDVRKEDREELNSILESVKGAFNDKFYEANRQWGGNKLSKRSRVALEGKLKE